MTVDMTVIVSSLITLETCSRLQLSLPVFSGIFFREKYQVPTVASLNTIMVDGTGMCGACRVTVGGQTKFVCVDGPEFDAHQVDFDEMMMRLNAYKGIDKKQPESV